MYTILTLDENSDWEALHISEAIDPFDPSTIAKHATDLHRAVMLDDEVHARCSLWWNNTPELDGKRVGAIGHFAAADAAAASSLLADAFRELSDHGCDVAVGPMDGNTWRSYRFVTENCEAPPFFLEPHNPDEYPEYFRKSGFHPLAQYGSSLNPDLSVDDPRTSALERKATEAGVHVRALDTAKFHEELSAIYSVTLRCFEGNYLYTPLREAEFIEQYAPLEAILKPEIVLLAERDADGVVGFIFALPDLAQAQRGEKIDTMIIKTLGIVPECRGMGLASHLASCCHQNARDVLGYRKSIHALMIDTNESQSISQHTAQRIRGYTLFSKDLTQ